MPSTSTSARVRTLPAIALVVGEGTPIPTLAAQIGAARFSSPEKLIASSFPADAVVLSPRDAAEALGWLKTIRGNRRLGLLSVLLTESCGAHADALSDGLATGANDALVRAAEIRHRWEALDRKEPVDGDDQLLTFLYLRPDYVLEPIADWQDERVYFYPLADLYCREREEGYVFLSRLQQRGLIEPVRLLERLHLCPDCSGAHLLFNELCPQCGSIDISEQNFLHCYACGGVAPQEQYVAHDSLRCPKCSVRLRHIGVDYDRALETLTCKSCDCRFTEPDMRARCARCRKQYPTESLIERRFYSLRISSAGEAAARSGSVGDLFALIDKISHTAHPAYFVQTLHWQLALHSRHAEVHFSLLALKFLNLQKLTSELSRGRVAQMLDTLARQLRELVRVSDLFMRDDEDLCWLLLPQTSAAGLAVLRGRIEAYGAASVQDDGRRIEIAIATLTTEDLDAAPNDPAQTDEVANSAGIVMGRLRESLE